MIQENTLTAEETMGIRALVSNAGNNNIPDCNTCYRIPGYAKMPRAQRRRVRAGVRKDLGCFSKARKPLRLRSNGDLIPRCLHHYVLEGLGEYLSAYLWYDHHGTLPMDGGLENQPAKLIEAIEVIRSEIRLQDKVEREHHDRRMRAEADVARRGMR